MLPFLEEHFQNNNAKAETQKIFMQAQISLIGNEEERRRYWINKLRT